MRRRLPLAVALLALGSVPRARAGEDLREQAFPWPVASLDVPAREGASLAVTLGTGEGARRVTVGPHAALVLEWADPARRDTPNADATLDQLVLAVPDEQRRRWQASDAGPRTVVISGPEGVSDLAESVLRPAPRGSRLAFRIVVRPEEEYAPAPDRLQRLRFGLWPGTKDEFLAFRRKEAARWRQAGAVDLEHVPAQGPHHVAPKRDADTADDGAFEVLETPAGPHEDFDGSALVTVAVGRGDTGQPVTSFTVARERQEAFEAWTRRNVGLPMAIVLDGRVVSSPVISSPLRDSVQVSLGVVRFDDAKRQAEGLADALHRGRITGLRLLAAVGPWSAGRRPVHVPLSGTDPLDVRVRAGGEAQDVGVRARFATDAPGKDDVSGGLQVALAVGALDSGWAGALVARTERSALLAALRKDLDWTDRVPVQADLLELLGRYGGGDPDALRLLLRAAPDPRPAVRSAAQRALARATAGPTAPTWRGLRSDADVNVRVLARAALVRQGAGEAGDREDVEGFLRRHAGWGWAALVREWLRQAPPAPPSRPQ